MLLVCHLIWRVLDPCGRDSQLIMLLTELITSRRICYAIYCCISPNEHHIERYEDFLLQGGLA
jgi:hypothetical protein